jgi:sentrin-specific protease 1
MRTSPNPAAPAVPCSDQPGLHTPHNACNAQDVFSFDLLLVPVNHANTHWTLAAVWPRARRIEHYDSLPSGGAARHVMDTLARYMQREAADKGTGGGGQGPGQRWATHSARNGVPRQEDGCACGVFAASLGAHLAAGRARPFGLSQADVPALRLRIAADCLARRATPLTQDE